MFGLRPASLLPLLFWALALLHAHGAHAQFGFFDQMFGGGGGGGGQQHHEPQNVPSDSAWYQSSVEKMYCDKYLCPDTLGMPPLPSCACVHFAHHCPCPFPSIEDKVELADGHRLCVSRGGFKNGESARKIELARKGML